VARRQFRGRFAIASQLARLSRHRTIEVTFANRLTIQADLSEPKYWELRVGDFGIEEAVWRLLVTTVVDGDAVMDVGANWGFISLLAAALVGPNGRVAAFEPNRRCVEQLRGHGAHALAPWLQVHHRAVSERSGELVRLSVPRFPYLDTGALVTLAPRANAQTVETITLDEVWRQWGMPRVRLLKIDVNGGEAAVVRGADALLRSGACEYVVAEVSDWTAHFGVTARATLLELAARGFSEIYLMDPEPPYWRPLNPDAWHSLPASSNVCAARSGLSSALLDRITACSAAAALRVGQI